MYALLNDFRSSNNNAEKCARKIINRSSDMAHVLARKLRGSYPKISGDTRILLNRNLVPLKHNFSAMSKEIKDAVYIAGGQLKRVELYLIAGGLGYVIFKCYRCCKQMHPAEELKARIRHKPIKSTLIALGVGLLIGKVL